MTKGGIGMAGRVAAVAQFSHHDTDPAQRKIHRQREAHRSRADDQHLRIQVRLHRDS